MEKPAKVIFSTISPAKSATAFAIAINTLSPDRSATPALQFGKPIINSLSPESSLTPASIEFADGTRVDISWDKLAVLGLDDLASLRQVSAMTLDSLITSSLLSPDELLRTDARKLFAIKLNVAAELSTNKEIRSILRTRIETILRES